MSSRFHFPGPQDPAVRDYIRSQSAIAALCRSHASDPVDDFSCNGSSAAAIAFFACATLSALSHILKKQHQLTLNLFDEPMATQLILDFAEEELICVFLTRDNHSPPKPAFLLFKISDVIAACRREKKKVDAEAHGATYTCCESMIRGCVDEMRVGVYSCVKCYGELIAHDIRPAKVGTHPINFISERERQ